MSILYTSLVKLPEKITCVDDAKLQLNRVVKKPSVLNNIKSEIIMIDEWHINIIREFDNISQYKDWIFSNDRNKSDDTLIKHGFYLYTKQAHHER